MELVVLFIAIKTVIGIEVMKNLHHRLLRWKSCWNPSRIDVIKHIFWSSSSRIPLVIAIWL